VGRLQPSRRGLRHRLVAISKTLFLNQTNKLRRKKFQSFYFFDHKTGLFLDRSRGVETTSTRWCERPIATVMGRIYYAGDGKANVSEFRPLSGMWYLNQSANEFTGTKFSVPTNKIVPADYDRDCKTDIVVYRSGTWYLQKSQSARLAQKKTASSEISSKFYETFLPFVTI